MPVDRKLVEWLREKFENWICQPPFERDIARFPDDESKYGWPRQYRDYQTELAWCAWKESASALSGEPKAVPQDERGFPWLPVDLHPATKKRDVARKAFDRELEAYLNFRLRAQPAAEQGVRVPEGWKLVPVEFYEAAEQFCESISNWRMDKEQFIITQREPLLRLRSAHSSLLSAAPARKD